MFLNRPKVEKDCLKVYDEKPWTVSCMAGGAAKEEKQLAGLNLFLAAPANGFNIFHVCVCV